MLVTGDKDALQLVGHGIRVFNASKNMWMDPAQVEEKFGIPPSAIRDYLAIVGDSSDNVPGLKGVGPVGAVKLIKAYGSLKGAISAAKKGDKALTPKLAQSLVDGEKTADLALSLIALDENVPLDAAPEDCRVPEPDSEKLIRDLAPFRVPLAGARTSAPSPRTSRRPPRAEPAPRRGRRRRAGRLEDRAQGHREKTWRKPPP